MHGHLKELLGCEQRHKQYSKLGREKKKEMHWGLFGFRRSRTNYMCSVNALLEAGCLSLIV